MFVMPTEGRRVKRGIEAAGGAAAPTGACCDVWRSRCSWLNCDGPLSPLRHCRTRPRGRRFACSLSHRHQAMGDSYVYVSCGSTGPAREDELAKSPKLTSPKKDIQRFQFRHAVSPWHLCKHPRLRRKIVNTRADLRVLLCLWQALRRTNVEFHALKTIRKQIANMELSLYGDTGGGDEDDVGEWEDDEVPTFVPGPRAPHSSSLIKGGDTVVTGKLSLLYHLPTLLCSWSVLLSVAWCAGKRVFSLESVARQCCQWRTTTTKNVKDGGKAANRQR